MGKFVPVPGTTSRNVKRYVRAVLRVRSLANQGLVAVSDAKSAEAALTGGQFAEAQRILATIPQP